MTTLCPGCDLNPADDTDLCDECAGVECPDCAPRSLCLACHDDLRFHAERDNEWENR